MLASELVRIHGSVPRRRRRSEMVNMMRPGNTTRVDLAPILEDRIGPGRELTGEVRYEHPARAGKRHDLGNFVNRDTAGFRCGELAVAGLEKIKTIGDAYMAAGGVPGPIADHAGRIVELGLGMLDRTALHARRTTLPLELRVGAHSGRVIAGVIGRRRFSYDLWGDTVNIASRMEAHGVAGAMQISQATASRLGDGFGLRSRGPVEIKGKEPMEAILVTAGGQSANSPGGDPVAR